MLQGRIKANLKGNLMVLIAIYISDQKGRPFVGTDAHIVDGSSVFLPKNRVCDVLLKKRDEKKNISEYTKITAMQFYAKTPLYS